MERIVGFLLFTWLAVLGIGAVIALLPVILFVVGFVGMMIILVLLGRLFGVWIFY